MSRERMQLLVATRNAHKTREFEALLGQDFEVSDLSAFPATALPEETGRTFEENARLKASAVSLAAGRVSPTGGQDRCLKDRHLLVLADDSGLEVDTLGGAPGIFSARYAGKNATGKENVKKLLRELERVGAQEISKRTARFRCALALARDGKIVDTYSGIVEGVIVDLPRGSAGFGYDPVFVPNGFDQTFGELPADVKNRISHRAGAVREFRVALESGEANQGLGGAGGGGAGAPG
jgi:XTP/dITP diphosphohydrolase